MIASHMLFVFAVFLFFVALCAAGSVYVRRARALSSTNDVETLLKRLVEVDRHKLALVAEDGMAAEPQAELQPWQIWDLTGGLRGLEALAANCEVLIELACYVQQWYPEALPVAEQLRLNTREVQWHLERLHGAEQRGHLEAAFPDYAQRAVAIYYGMTQHVLTLFELSQVPGYVELRAALSIRQRVA